MRVIASDKVEVHLIRPRTGRRSVNSIYRSEFLLLRRSPHRRTLRGVWQPVTGGIERGETAWQAARREVSEETGLTPVRWWALEHLSIYYEPAADAFAVLPVFVAELAPGDTPTLSDEHDAWRFVGVAAAKRTVLWDAQRLAIDAVAREILSGRPAARVRDITALVAAAPAPRRARRPAPRRAAKRPTSPTRKRGS